MINDTDTIAKKKARQANYIRKAREKTSTRRETLLLKKKNPKNHIHHIIPLHAGGTNDRENLIEVSLSEHAYLHQLLWIKNGDYRDFIAWRLLSSKIGRDGVFAELNRQHSKRMKGYFWCHNPNDHSKIKAIRAPQLPPEGFIIGRGTWQVKKKGSKGFSGGSKWFYNPLNKNEQKMIHKGEPIPEGWKPGRGKQKNPSTLGNLCFYNPLNSKERIKIAPGIAPPEGWLPGQGKKKTFEYKNDIHPLAGRSWYSNSDTRETKTFYPKDIIPEGFSKGRVFF